MEPFSRRRWTTIPAPSVSYSVHEGKHFFSAVSELFLKLIYHGASTVVHLLLLKFSIHKCLQFWLSDIDYRDGWNYQRRGQDYPNQCDQILQIIATSKEFILYFVKFWTYFGKLLFFWLNIHGCKRHNIEDIILPSGHTAENVFHYRRLF